MFGLGPLELTIVAVILVLIFGPKKIPEIAQGIRDAIRHVRSVFSEAEGDKSDTNK